MQTTTTFLSILRVITSSMRGTSMTTLAGGPREPRAWKLASVVRGGAVGKGLGYSTSLAAYSTWAGRAWSSSVAASCSPHERDRHRLQASVRHHRPMQQPRPRSHTVQTAAVSVSAIVRIPGAHRRMGCGAARLCSGGTVEACTCGRRSWLAGCVSPVELYGIYQTSPDVTKRG
jgi:hypothetical protein